MGMTITISAEVTANTATVEAATVSTIQTLLDSIGDQYVVAASMTTDTQGSFSLTNLY